MNDEIYIFCIDTDQYAGNFERPMCAFMTGMIGECEVGAEEANLYEEDGLEQLDTLVVAEPDDHGCHRPVAIQPTPGWFNAGGESHRDGTTDDVLRRAVIKSLAEQADLNRKVYADKNYGETRALEYDRKIEELNNGAPLTGYIFPHAYNSVGIFMHRVPTAKEVALLKGRAHIYAKSPTSHGSTEWVDPFNIEGFRLVRRYTVDEELTF